MMTNRKHFIPHETYQTILENMPVCTVDVLFFNSDKTKTLLFKRNNEPLKGEYFSMGGRLKKDETFEECAIRQTKLETGLDIDPGKVIFVGVQRENYPNSAFGETSYCAIDLYFGYIINDENTDLVLDSQHDESRWFFVDDSSLHPYLKSKIEQTLKLI